MTDKVRPRNLIFGVLIFSAIVIGMAQFGEGIFNQAGYNVVQNESLTTLNQTQDFRDLARTLKDKTNEAGTSSSDPFDQFVTNILTGTKNFFDLPSIVITVIEDTAEVLNFGGEGGFAIAILTTIVLLIGSFAVIEIITKGQI